MHHNQPDDQCQRTHDFKIEQRLNTDAAYLVQLPHAGNASYHGAEDDRRNDHFNQLDKTVTERLHRNTGFRVEMAEQNADGDGGQNLEIQMLIAFFGCVNGLH